MCSGDDSLSIKVIDFGVSKIVEGVGVGVVREHTGNAGTWKYMAAEVKDVDQLVRRQEARARGDPPSLTTKPYNGSVDIYSAGVVSPFSARSCILFFIIVCLLYLPRFCSHNILPTLHLFRRC